MPDSTFNFAIFKHQTKFNFKTRDKVIGKNLLTESENSWRNRKLL